MSVLSVGQAIARTLHSYGVDTVFGIPGTHNLELYREIESLGIRAVTARHEQGAGYAADGWAYRTGRPGVVITTSGPGVLNALSSVASAFCESRPLLVLSPGPALDGSALGRGRMHETRSTADAMRGATDSVHIAHDAADAVDAVHAAFANFASRRPRPVYIEVPLDVLNSRVEFEPSILVRRTAPGFPKPVSELIAEATSSLERAQQPVIIVGGGARGASAQVIAVAETLQAAVLTTINGKGIVPESHRLSLGANIRLPAAAKLLAAADTVLIVGSKLGEGDLWETEIRPNGPVIRIDLDSDQQDRFRGELFLHGDATAILTRIVERLRVHTRVPLELSAQREVLIQQAEEIAPQLWQLACAIALALPPGAVMTGDSSQIVYLGTASAFRPNSEGSFIFMPTYATLGYGLPAAIGAKLASPESPVVCVLGDGALMFSVQELATAVENNLDLVIVCVDNGGYGEIKANQVELGISPVAVDLHQPDWPALARSFGACGVRVEDQQALVSSLRQAIRSPGVHLLHLPIEAWRAALREGTGSAPQEGSLYDEVLEHP